MKRVAFVSAIIATGILALSGFRAGSIALGCTAIVIGVVWLLILWKSVKRTELTILLGAETAIAILGVLYGASVYLAGIAIVLAIMSWDFALTETAIASFPAELTREFTIRHVIRIGIIAGIGLLLLVIPLQIHIHLGFRTALGLVLGAFMLFAILLKLMNRHNKRRVERHQSVVDRLAMLRDAMKKKDGRP